MSYLTLAQLRNDTVQARDFARKLALRGPGDHGHGLVWTLFGDDPDATRDFLYREAEPGRLLIVSARPPKGDEAVWSLKSRPYTPTPAAGQRLGFSLRANPTISWSQKGRARSLVRDVLLHAKKQAGRPLSPEEREEACLSWLEARAPQLGVKLDRDLSHVAAFQQLRVPRKSGKPAEFLAVDFEGVLAVEDPAPLSRALTTGIGKGRAYGLGLLLLRPLEG
jgi:CRISPR system Cascade subunit CasE